MIRHKNPSRLFAAATLALLAAATFATTALADPRVIDLYPGAAPGSEGVHAEEVWQERGKGIVDRSVASVHQPTLTAYLPLAEKSTGVGIIVAPGGGYSHLAIDKEGHDIAKWLSNMGVAAFVLKYRLPRTEGHSYTIDTALTDAKRAVRLVRSRAGEWNLDSQRIGMMGFSAGGDLAARAGMGFDKGEAGAADLVERQTSRPDFLVLGYPLIPNELTVTAETPPAFLVHANDDRLTAEHSVRFYLALKKAGVSAELHVYSKGGHGFGILNRDLPVSAWPVRFEQWLRQVDLTR
ncbi:MAG: alpha/beta hydrolase [Bryobacterales bacterium]